jgi:hypothetical protein
MLIKRPAFAAATFAWLMSAHRNSCWPLANFRGVTAAAALKRAGSPLVGLCFDWNDQVPQFMFIAMNGSAKGCEAAIEHVWFLREGMHTNSDGGKAPVATWSASYTDKYSKARNRLICLWSNPRASS